MFGTRIIGAFMLVAGAGLLFFFAFAYETSLRRGQDYYQRETVLNLGLMSDREIGCTVGAMFLVGGFLLFGLAGIGDEVRRCAEGSRDNVKQTK
ncbi:MAG: hypothetical protein WD749_01115 [Phycisphaerales bacterium]